MTYFLSSIFLVFALAGGETPWYNYPGWEVWKFFNLLLFIGALIFLLRRPIGASLVARRDTIRRELMRAQEERRAALAKLEEVETRLARLDAEVETVRAQAKREAEAERESIVRATAEETRRLREQAQREIESAGKVARQDLRRFAAEQSVRLAEDMIRRDIGVEDDTRLMNDYIGELGGIKG
ncbi:MAG: F-type H+-transporting ATPase subunit b [Pyrinomonadaceae bacterium]|jgi:F0F1-type ATP synthase membrane subunit b/b'|nr:F-type H+-transporting ATPase subunit b [Pyrinomonadaceae bacterium]